MESRFGSWLLLTGRRNSVAFGLLLVMTGLAIVPSVTGFAVRNTTPLVYVASTLIGGNVTLVTVVVAINQVILSQEMESPDSLREEIEGTAAFRTASIDGSVPAPRPTDFLQQLLQQPQKRVQTLEGQLANSTDGSNDRLLNELPEHCEQLHQQLKSASDDRLSTVVVPLLRTDYDDYIHECRQLQAKYDDERHEQLHATLDELLADLENLAIVRQYVATAFTKEELATLSRSLLYVAIVAVPMALALLFQLSTYAGSSPPTAELLAFTVLTTTVGLLPLALLIAYVLRIAFIAQIVAGITPFKA